ncbi:MAG TPA: dolichyl-phosphate beta-glucosyltransferase [Anaerolineales bacterium]|nr:dolichyl-phosphate beta-glucosyltransferase [Anaerolineales bacterium]
MSAPFLSVIIPAHNEESRLPRALGELFAFVDKQEYASEIVVVENGSHDRTFEVAQKFTQHFPNLKVLHEDQPGKGRAVRRGVLTAGGEYRFIADADFSMPVKEINRFLPPACTSDIAIASREASGSVRYNEPAYRHLTGRVFNLLIRTLVLPRLQDTQCGFKCFHAPVAEDIFRFQTLTGWSFDVELLAIARRRGYEISEIGIPWYYTPGSKINVLRDSWRMFLDLLAIRSNARRGVYDVKA